MTDLTKNHGIELIAKSAPGPYPITAQQLKMRRVAEECGIVKGIKKADLMLRMKSCVGPAMRKADFRVQEDQDGHNGLHVSEL